MLSSPLRATMSFRLSEGTVTTVAKAIASSIGLGMDLGAVDASIDSNLESSRYSQ